ncbi:DUF4168 domain-containing protein [Aurantiacibacter odishensis]|uniref:DUF4168 domain-containing protein n=1 Tax=Aurantiacibacter odishensis TaxID=1155476 RepID=UPI000E736C7D|nr:DUF4168 domain-containing protein [Aurantiacibacter odishensis]
MRFICSSLAAIALAAPVGVAAQESATTAPPATQAPQQALPTSADISDEEVSQFALAALIVQQIAADEAIPQEEKQATVQQAVEQIGVAPQRYNTLARATQNDPALAERVNLAANAHIEAAQSSQ